MKKLSYIEKDSRGVFLRYNHIKGNKSTTRSAIDGKPEDTIQLKIYPDVVMQVEKSTQWAEPLSKRDVSTLYEECITSPRYVALVETKNISYREILRSAARNDGLPNVGNSCFINAGLQMLRLIPEFAPYLQKDGSYSGMRAHRDEIFGDAHQRETLRYVDVIIERCLKLNPGLRDLVTTNVSIRNCRTSTEGRGDGWTHIETNNEDHTVLTRNDVKGVVKPRIFYTEQQMTNLYRKFILRTAAHGSIKRDQPSEEYFLELFSKLPPELEILPSGGPSVYFSRFIQDCINDRYIVTELEQGNEIYRYEFMTFVLPKYLFFKSDLCPNTNSDMSDTVILSDALGSHVYRLAAVSYHLGADNNGHYVAYVARNTDGPTKYMLYNDDECIDKDSLPQGNVPDLFLFIKQE